MDTFDSRKKLRKPNIIMVLVDGLRARDLSLYGYDRETDKNIKKIAEECVVFNKAFSTSGASDTADTSIFSGQFPTTSGFIHQNPRTEDIEVERLKRNTFWLPSYLQKNGYNTISISPQHLWFKIGYDYCLTKEGKGIGKHLDFPAFRKVMLALPNWVYTFGKKMTKIRTSPVFTPAKEIIDVTMDRIKETKGPFYMYMQILDTHCPYAGVDVPEVTGNTKVSEVVENIKEPFQREYVKKRFFDSATVTMEQTKEKLDRSIMSVDKQIGILVDFLKKERMWNNTIFIILADHGENYGEHGNYFCRGGLYDPSIHIPLIMHLPGLPNKKIDSIVSNVDISATILDYMGEKPKKIDGKSTIPLINGEIFDDGSFRDKIYMADGFCKHRFAIRTNNRKLIISENGRCFLCGMEHNDGKIEEYDLDKDPFETQNIYSGSNELQRLLEAEMEKVKPVEEEIVSEVVSN